MDYFYDKINLLRTADEEVDDSDIKKSLWRDLPAEFQIVLRSWRDPRPFLLRSSVIAFSRRTPHSERPGSAVVVWVNLRSRIIAITLGKLQKPLALSIKQRTADLRRRNGHQTRRNLPPLLPTRNHRPLNYLARNGERIKKGGRWPGNVSTAMNGTSTLIVQRDRNHSPSKRLSINGPTRISLQLRTTTIDSNSASNYSILLYSNSQQTLKPCSQMILPQAEKFAIQEVPASETVGIGVSYLSAESCPIKAWIGRNLTATLLYLAELWTLKISRSSSKTSFRNSTRSFPRRAIPSSTASITTQRACKAM